MKIADFGLRTLPVVTTDRAGVSGALEGNVLFLVGTVGAVLLSVAATTLVARRWAGALERPLALPAMLVAAAGLVIAAALIRAAFGTASRSRKPAWPFLLGSAVLSAVVVSIAAAISLPQTSPLALAVVWVLVVAEETWVWGKLAGQGRLTAWHRRSERIDRVPVESKEVDLASAPDSPAETHTGLVRTTEPPAEDVLQQLTRSRAANGAETVDGWLRVTLAARQRNTSVHVAFCPPFPRAPRVAVESLEGPDLRIKVVQILPYGARCDLKLAETSDAATTVLLRFSAQSEPLPPGARS